MSVFACAFDGAFVCVCACICVCVWLRACVLACVCECVLFPARADARLFWCNDAVGIRVRHT